MSFINSDKTQTKIRETSVIDEPSGHTKLPLLYLTSCIGKRLAELLVLSIVPFVGLSPERKFIEISKP